MAPARSPKAPIDWHKKCAAAKPPRTVVLATDFAGIKAGSVMYIGAPDVIAQHITLVPRGETRTIAWLRGAMARHNGADATCPVTTAIYLRMLAEAALADLQAGAGCEQVVPFWRVIAPDSKIAARLSCAPALIADLRLAESPAPSAG